jgi:hypothetical protein
MLWNGNECGKTKTKVMRISRQKFPVQTKNNWRMWNLLNI